MIANFQTKKINAASSTTSTLASGDVVCAFNTTVKDNYSSNGISGRISGLTVKGNGQIDSLLYIYNKSQTVAAESAAFSASNLDEAIAVIVVTGADMVAHGSDYIINVAVDLPFVLQTNELCAVLVDNAGIGAVTDGSGWEFDLFLVLGNVRV